MKIYKIIGTFCALLIAHNLFAQSPGGISSHSVWLIGNFRPETADQDLLNFNPVTSLDKSDLKIKLPAIETLQRSTIFTVYEDSTVDQATPIWKMTGDFGDLQLSPGVVSSKVQNSTVTFDEKSLKVSQASKRKAIINTYMCNQGTATGSDNLNYKENSIRFGNPDVDQPNLHSLKSVSEFILYERNLSDMEVSRIETYLALKYGITLESNYINSADEVIWDYETDSRYSHHIAGILRDDKSGLLQKQGAGYNNPEKLEIGINKIEKLNTKNSGQLKDGDYLVWGDNDEGCRLKQNVVADANDFILSDKKWLMRASGKNAEKIATEIKIDTKKFISGSLQKEDFYLVINRSGTGNFKESSCEYINPNNISADKIASFSRIIWDADGSGTDVFSFGYRPGFLARMQQMTDSTKNPNGTLKSFEVYPNPVSVDGNYQLSVELENSTDVLIEIYDLSMKRLDSYKGSGQSSYLFSKHINGPPATYFIRLLTPSFESYRMMVIQ